MTDAKRALWDAVDALTKPTTRKVGRDMDAAEWIDELADVGQGSFCRISDYRAAMLAYGQIPALWDQAEWSLGTGIEQKLGESGSSCLRERSPADLDLMETMLQVREAVAAEFKARRLAPRDGAKAQIRQITTHFVTENDAQTIGWWTHRFAQWTRIIESQLDMLDRAPKPVHLRDSACPRCETRQVVIRDDQTGERKVWPALRIDFVDETIRAAYCLHCGASWFRGSDLYALKDSISDAGAVAS